MIEIIHLEMHFRLVLRRISVIHLTDSTCGTRGPWFLRVFTFASLKCTWYRTSSKPSRCILRSFTETNCRIEMVDVFPENSFPVVSYQKGLRGEERSMSLSSN